MKRITKLKIVYSSAGVCENMDCSITEKADSDRVDFAKILREWDPGIPPHDLDTIISRTTYLHRKLEDMNRRSVIKNFRAPSGFNIKITLMQYCTEDNIYYCGHDIEYIERLVNGRLRNVFDKGGVVLLRARRDGHKLQGTIYEVPQSVDFDIEHTIPRALDWNSLPGVLLTYTTDGCYRTVYSHDVYDQLGDIQLLSPIATVVG